MAEKLWFIQFPSIKSVAKVKLAVLDDYLKKSKKCIEEGDLCMAESYLIVASTIDPDSFLIKIETYKLHKLKGDFKATSQCFADFFCDPEFWDQSKGKINSKSSEPNNILKNFFVEEMKYILYSISYEWQNCLSIQEFKSFFHSPIDNAQFYRLLWNQLEPKHRVSSLIKFCSFFPKNIEMIKDLYLHVIMKYPDQECIIKCAVDLIYLRNSSLENSDDNLYKFFKEKYVFYILPVIFSSESYYETYGSNDSTLEEHFLSGLKNFIDDFTDGMNDDKRKLYEQKLIEIISLIGKHKKWDIFAEGQLNLDCIESNIETMSSYIHKYFRKDNEVLDLSVKDVDRSSLRKIAFYSIVLFVILFCRFMSKIGNRIICEKLSGFPDGNIHLNLKKRKLMNYAPTLIASDNELIENINLLLKLSASIDFIRQEFYSLIQQIELNHNVFYVQYRICHSLYKADYSDALQILKNFEFSNNNKDDDFSSILKRLNYYVQNLTCSIKLNNLEDAKVFMNEIIGILCAPASADAANPNMKFGHTLTANLMRKDYKKFEIQNQIGSLISKEIDYCSVELASEYSNSRQIMFLCPTLENVTGLLIDAAIILFSSIPSDMALGHTIVMSQYRWPYFYSAFQKSILQIKNMNMVQPPEQVKLTFVYPLFSLYVNISDILEEFKALTNDYSFDFKLGQNSIIRDRQEVTALLLNLLNRPDGLQTDLFLQFFWKEIKQFLVDFNL